MKIPTILKTKMIKYLCLALVLIGCNKYTPQDALRDMNKANDFQPKVVADYVGQHFPCNTKTDSVVKIDTMYQYVEILCPPTDTIQSNDTIYLDKIKNVTKTNVVRKVVALPSKSVIITKYIQDSAKLKSLYLTISQTQQENKDCVSKQEKKSEWIKWLIICLCASAILNIIQLRL